MILLYEGSEEYRVILTSGKELNITMDELGELQDGLEELKEKHEDLILEFNDNVDRISDLERENDTLKDEIVVLMEQLQEVNQD